MSKKLDLRLIERMGFIPAPNPTNDPHYSIFNHKTLPLSIFPGHSMRQIVRNFLSRKLYGQADFRDLPINQMLDVIYSFKQKN